VAEAAADVTGVRKKCFNSHWYKKELNSPLLMKKQKPSKQSTVHDVVSGIVVVELVEDCHGWRQRLWRTPLMVGMFFCCGCVIYDMQYVELLVFLHNYPHTN
jgi:hypothetical protein